MTVVCVLFRGFDLLFLVSFPSSWLNLVLERFILWISSSEGDFRVLSRSVFLVILPELPTRDILNRI